jgi:DNA-binding LacI/PurR family transcriptional regulator
LRQVAERAGVSLGTASAVFSGQAAVSTGARAAVHQAAHALRYRPRRTTTGSHPSPGGMRSIGLVIRLMEHGLRTNPFYAGVLHGAQQVCANLDLSLSYELTVGIEPDDPLPLAVQRRQTHGLLLVGYLPEHTVEEIAATGVPCVLVDNSVPGVTTRPLWSHVDSVRNDDEQGGYLATRHLIELGHTDPVPAMIAGPSAFPSIRDRISGYRRAVLEAGHRVDPQLVRSTSLSPAGGRTEMSDLLELPTPPTAVFCCNDATALGALATLRERGISVPDEVSVVGYDDIEMAAQAAPPLTTVRVDKELLGAQGVWHLVQRIGQPGITGRETRLGVVLVPRGSSGPRPDRPTGLPRARRGPAARTSHDASGAGGPRQDLVPTPYSGPPPKPTSTRQRPYEREL